MQANSQHYVELNESHSIDVKTLFICWGCAKGGLNL